MYRKECMQLDKRKEWDRKEEGCTLSNQGSGVQ